MISIVLFEGKFQIRGYMMYYISGQKFVISDGCVQFISLTILLHEFCGNSKIIVILPDHVEPLGKKIKF